MRKLLCFSGSGDPELEYLDYNEIMCIDYNLETGEGDLHTLDLPEKDFDFVMVNQILEHVYNPFLCLENIYSHMRPGGFIYANVPTINILHMSPEHYYTGYTPVGFGAIFKSVGFEILEMGQWGNLEYIEKLFKTHKWPDYRQLTKSLFPFRRRPITNEFENPAVCWVLAQKST
ncbi:MAG: methyltransferase domain-containing protein [Candidatus Omnitrophota bacterium]|nr:MAG: methyltransferase domain-containing protein [Candidatus Omnitrophota bacterium]